MQENSREHFVGQVAVKVIIRRDDKVLFVRNYDESRWDFPGGRLDLNELPSEGMAREIKEEIGCPCQVGRVVYLNQYFHTAANLPCLFINYEVTIANDAEIRLAEGEIPEYCWFKPETLQSEEIFPNNLDALAVYSAK